jgi:hypothetical protein
MYEDLSAAIQALTCSSHIRLFWLDHRSLRSREFSGFDRACARLGVVGV